MGVLARFGVATELKATLPVQVASISLEQAEQVINHDH